MQVENSTVQPCEGKNIEKGILITIKNSDIRIMQPIRVTINPCTRVRKWHQFKQIR